MNNTKGRKKVNMNKTIKGFKTNYSSNKLAQSIIERKDLFTKEEVKNAYERLMNDDRIEILKKQTLGNELRRIYKEK